MESFILTRKGIQMGILGNQRVLFWRHIEDGPARLMDSDAEVAESFGLEESSQDEEDNKRQFFFCIKGMWLS
jgi:hypothetical protein